MGCSIVFAAYLISAFHVLPRGLAAVLFVSLATLGVAITLMARKRLKDGIRDEQWTKEEIALLRRLVEYPAFTVMQWLALLLMAASSIAGGHSHLQALCWPLFWANMTIADLRTSLQPKAVAGSGAVWQDALPIRSEHWGEARAANTGSHP